MTLAGPPFYVNIQQLLDGYGTVDYSTVPGEEGQIIRNRYSVYS